MLQRINSLADRLLSRAIGSVDAGACIADHGLLCFCQRKYGAWRLDCLGNCRYVGGSCTTRP